MDVDVDVMDIQLQMQVQLSDHSAGSGTYRVLLFAGIAPYCCASLLANAVLLFLHLSGLRKLPNANHCGLCPPTRGLAAGGAIEAVDFYLLLLARIRVLDPILAKWEIFNVDWNGEIKREHGLCTCQMDARSPTLHLNQTERELL